MRACQTDTPEDDRQATETITGDHAIVNFHKPDMAPTPLIRIDGVWKLDMPAFIAATPGYTVEQLAAFTRATTAIINTTKNTLNDPGKYADVDSVAADVTLQLSKIQAPQN